MKIQKYSYVMSALMLVAMPVLADTTSTVDGATSTNPMMHREDRGGDREDRPEGMWNPSTSTRMHWGEREDGVDATTTSSTTPFHERSDRGERRGLDRHDMWQHEMDQNDELENEEGDVHEHMDVVAHQMNTVDVPAVDTSFATYGDAINAVKPLLATLDQLEATNVTSASTTLSATEQSLLNSLLSMHKNHFQNLHARIQDVRSQIQELTDVLSPIADQPVSSFPAIKRALTSDVQGIQREVANLKNFANASMDVVNQETL